MCLPYRRPDLALPLLGRDQRRNRPPRRCWAGALGSARAMRSLPEDCCIPAPTPRPTAPADRNSRSPPPPAGRTRRRGPPSGRATIGARLSPRSAGRAHAGRDLDGAEKIGRLHLAEALSYRALAEDLRRAVTAFGGQGSVANAHHRSSAALLDGGRAAGSKCPVRTN